jgi:hypothetical protein
LSSVLLPFTIHKHLELNVVLCATEVLRYFFLLGTHNIQRVATAAIATSAVTATAVSGAAATASASTTFTARHRQRSWHSVQPQHQQQVCRCYRHDSVSK